MSAISERSRDRTAAGQSALRGDFIAVSRETARVFDSYVAPGAIGADPRDDVTDYVRTRDFKPTTNFIPVRPLSGGQLGRRLILLRVLFRVNESTASPVTGSI